MSRIRLQAACDALGLTARGVQAMAARGEIPGAAKIGRVWTDCKLDGKREWICYEGLLPVLFRTRADARAHAEAKYGYYRRSDLREMGWKMPVPVRVSILLAKGVAE